jgi:GntR family transcriptional regulator
MATLDDVLPLYARVHRGIADQIESGALRSRDRLPTERALCEKFGVSRVTIRRALQELQRDGLISAAPGRGYHVSPEHVTEPTNALVSFTAIGTERGLTVSSRVVAKTIRPATIDEAEILRTAPGGAVFELVRVRCLNGLPIALSRSRIAHHRVIEIEDVDFSTASLYETLERRWKIVPSRADYSIEAARADDREASLLEVEQGSPLLVARETMYDQYGVPTDLAETAYRGDRYRFHTTLSRAAASARPLLGDRRAPGAPRAAQGEELGVVAPGSAT